MIEEKDLNETILNDFIKSIIEDEKTTKLFKKNLESLAHLDSADIIYEEIKNII
jgi:UDP-N-acetylglucosamine:LPS N-acetylglucosamine transferase